MDSGGRHTNPDYLAGYHGRISDVKRKRWCFLIERDSFGSGCDPHASRQARQGGCATPETIRQNFPTLSLEQIYGAIAFYLGHQEGAEEYLRNLEKKWEELEHAAKPADPELQQRIEEARKRLLAKQA